MMRRVELNVSSGHSAQIAGQGEQVWNEMRFQVFNKERINN